MEAEGRMSRQKHDMMSASFQTHDTSRLLALHSKRPLWLNSTIHTGSNSFILDFNNRVRAQSIKNVQLVDSNRPEVVLLQTGKVEKNVFILDFAFPFSPLQAFAFALSGCDFKLT